MFFCMMFGCGKTTTSRQMELSKEQQSDCVDLDSKSKIDESTIKIGNIWQGIYHYLGESLSPWPPKYESKILQHYTQNDSPFFSWTSSQTISFEPIIGIDLIRTEKRDKAWMFVITREDTNSEEILTDTISFKGDYSFSRRDTEEQKLNHGDFVRYLGIGEYDAKATKLVVKKMYGIDENGKLTETYNPDITFSVPLDYIGEDM